MCEMGKFCKKIKLKNTRLVIFRIGVVLSPAGGALKKMLAPLKYFIGGKFGSGKQFISWICIEDVINAFYFAIFNENIKGPINIVSPNPVTNLNFIKILGKILSRPYFFTVPKFVIKGIFGEMGKEIVLSSTRAYPEILLNFGFKFYHENLEDSLRYLLGKKNNL